MPRKTKKDTGKTPKLGSTTTEPKIDDKPQGKGCSVIWQEGGEKTRFYTEEINGKDYLKLAKEFATKKNGKVV